MSAACSVHVRVRPSQSRGEWVLNGNNIQHGASQRAFRVGHIFPEAARNDEVFERTTRGLVGRVVEGESGTVLAYGQTSSGKTHAMRGCAGDAGLLQQAIEHLFVVMRGLKQDRVFCVRIAYFEVCDPSPPCAASNTALRRCRVHALRALHRRTTLT